MATVDFDAFHSEKKKKKVIFGFNDQQFKTVSDVCYIKCVRKISF